MPYIKKDIREKLAQDIFSSSSPGDLNYVFTLVSLSYRNKKGESYQTYNDIMGALVGCLLELYRTKIAPYEDKKIKENGDVE